MSNDIITLLIKQLKANFNDIAVYDEPTQQGLNLPCFMVGKKLMKRTRLANRNDSQLYFVHMQYMTDNTDNVQAEVEGVEDILQSQAVRYLGDSYHVNELELDRLDNMLVATFSVEILGRWSVDGVKMKHMKEDTNFDEE